MRAWLTGLTWTDLLIIGGSLALIYKILYPKQEPIVRLTPNELRNVLEIQTKRREFAAESWITGKQEFPMVRGRLWQRERRLA